MDSSSAGNTSTTPGKNNIRLITCMVSVLARYKHGYDTIPVFGRSDPFWRDLLRQGGLQTLGDEAARPLHPYMVKLAEWAAEVGMVKLVEPVVPRGQYTWVWDERILGTRGPDVDLYVSIVRTFGNPPELLLVAPDLAKYKTLVQELDNSGQVPRELPTLRETLRARWHENYQKLQ